jgi:hypothetical protein
MLLRSQLGLALRTEVLWRLRVVLIKKCANAYRVEAVRRIGVAPGGEAYFGIEQWVWYQYETIFDGGIAKRICRKSLQHCAQPGSELWACVRASALIRKYYSAML